MKHIILIAVVFVISIDAQSQMFDSTWKMPGTTKTVIRRYHPWSESYPIFTYDTIETKMPSIDFKINTYTGQPMPNGMVTFSLWKSDLPLRYLYDSGTVQIFGDTLLVIRNIAKLYDSVVRANRELNEVTMQLNSILRNVNTTSFQRRLWYQAIEHRNDVLSGKLKPQEP